MTSENPHYHPDTPTLPCFDSCPDAEPLTDAELDALLAEANADLLRYVKQHSPEVPPLVAAIRAASEAIARREEDTEMERRSAKLVAEARQHARNAKLYALISTALALAMIVNAVVEHFI